MEFSYFKWTFAKLQDVSRQNYAQGDIPQDTALVGHITHSHRL